MATSVFDIIIGKDGTIELHCKGFRGPACLETVKIFEKMAGEIKSQEPATGFETGGGYMPNPPKNVGSFEQTLL